MKTLRGVSTLLIISVYTLLLCIPLYLMGVLRPLTRGALRGWLDRHMDGIIDVWVGLNRGLFALLRTTRVDIEWRGCEALSRSDWYAVISNHQTWSDILVLQNSLRDRVPPLKFFTKRELIWVPLIGVAMYLLGFPYVRRFSRDKIAANPDLARLDRDATLEACNRFRAQPASVLNFLEGTRFTPAKHAAQNGRFRHLLNPKVGGLSYVLEGLSDRISKLVNVTIIYPDGVPTFWHFLQGRCRRVRVEVTCHDLPPLAANGNAAETRRRLTPWIDALWRAKDERLSEAFHPPN
jgi:1-acyl-sn-glycerol-3-phosphate acyltransferase